MAPDCRRAARRGVSSRVADQARTPRPRGDGAGDRGARRDARRHCASAADPRLLLDVALVRLARPRRSTRPAALLERIERPRAAARPPGRRRVPQRRAVRPHRRRRPRPRRPRGRRAVERGGRGSGTRPRRQQPAPRRGPHARARRTAPTRRRQPRSTVACAPSPRRRHAVARRAHDRWADHVLGQLKGMAKALYTAGRFVGADDGGAVFALPTAPHRQKLRGAPRRRRGRAWPPTSADRCPCARSSTMAEVAPTPRGVGADRRRPDDVDRPRRARRRALRTARRRSIGSTKPSRAPSSSTTSRRWSADAGDDDSIGNLLQQVQEMQAADWWRPRRGRRHVVEGQAGGGVVKVDGHRRRRVPRGPHRPARRRPRPTSSCSRTSCSPPLHDAMAQAQELQQPKLGGGDSAAWARRPRRARARRPARPAATRGALRRPGPGAHRRARPAARHRPQVGAAHRVPPAEAAAGGRRRLAARHRRRQGAVTFCTRCFNIAEGELCAYLPRRPAGRARVLCVVEEPRDIVAVEKTGEFQRPLPRAAGRDQPDRGHRPRAAARQGAARPRSTPKAWTR